MRYALAALSVVAVVGFAVPACAQLSYGPGALVARVHDTSNRPLSGALVIVAGPATRSATSDRAGLVILSALPAGWYDVSVSLAGYATFEERVAVTSVTTAPQVITPTLQASSLANTVSSAAQTLPQLGSPTDPILAHAIEMGSATNVSATGGGAGIALDGTLPYETRVELDGIPIAGGATSSTVLRLRDQLGLGGVDVTSGPFASADVRDTIGGVVNFRTPSVDDTRTIGVDDVRGTSFGTFEHARAVQTFGDLAVAFDAVTGGALDRSDALKARYTFSPGTSVGIASYDLSGVGNVGTATVAASAPTFAVDARVALGDGTLQARSYRSSFDETGSQSTFAAPTESARTSGFTLAYDLTRDTQRIGFAFDRRSESETLAGLPQVSQSFTTFSLRGEAALASALTLRYADAYAGGTLVRARSDPQLEVDYRVRSKLTLRLEAGSAYATAPGVLLALRDASSPLLPPETAFGERFSADDRFDANDRLWLTAYDERRFDTFTPLADATNRGAGIGFERSPARGFGALAYAALDRAYGYGAAQPFARIASGAFPYDPGAQLAEIPFAKMRTAITYRTSATCVSRVGVTFVGANSAFAPGPVALGEAAVCIPLFGAFEVRAGESNLFGIATRDPVIGPLFPPREFTLSIGFK